MSEPRLTVENPVHTSGGYPSQWDARTPDGRVVYVRYRHGWLSVRVGALGDTGEFAGVRGAEVVGKVIGGDWSGCMTFDELRGHTADVIAWGGDFSLARRLEIVDEPNDIATSTPNGTS